MPATPSPFKSGGLWAARRAAPRFSRFTRATRWARRFTFLVHRWLGIALALLMAVWAISGVVMMYVAFPETTAQERLAGLEPLDLSACCANASPPSAGIIETASIEMAVGQPVLRWTGPDGIGMMGLGGTTPLFGSADAGEIARTHMAQTFGAVPPMRLAPTERDQWTVTGQFRRHAPLYKVSFADDRGTVLYVSGATGEVVQDTSSHERFWNWLGSVPHWLYFTALRELQPLWYNVVVYASLLGVFLTATGMYVGLRMYGRGKRKSPFRGLALWHHWTGLIFGVVTLTWVASGLFSMNPWGWFESDGPGAEVKALAGRAATAEDAAALYQALAARPQAGVVSAELSLQGGRPWAILARADGTRVRASLPELQPAPLTRKELARLAGTARPGAPVRSQQLITAPDAYHYSHHDDAVLPAWRVIYAGEDATRFYFDPRTGELINFADAPTRAFRWWHLGLHRFDLPVLRERPVWDLVVLPLMLGVSLLCVIGLWLGVRRLRRSSARSRD
jgi:hypothetical protein